MASFQDALARFADALAQNFAVRIEAQPEDQLKAPVQGLLESAGSLFKVKVATRTETRVQGLGGRPDIGVTAGNLPVGYVELKAPGKGARTARLRGADQEQWRRFQALPNLLYSDGSEWALYRSGEPAGAPVRLGADLTLEGADGLSAEAGEGLERLLRDFLGWEPIVPASPRALAEVLAPLCHLLRDDVLLAVQREGSSISELAREWRETLFPDADDRQFSDAYAQAVTYALLLARFEGEARLSPSSAEKALERKHGLLARVLRMLLDPQVRSEIDIGVDLLSRAIDAVDPRALAKRGDDPWLYFYEDFLAKYDPKLRNDRGVYYTPIEVIRAQTRLATHLLGEAFDKRLALADDGVVILDPGAGTGAYLLACLSEGLSRVEETLGPGAIAGRATIMAENLHGFEVLVGPYAVAHLRVTQRLQDAGAELPPDGAHVYLTDTLESPHAEPRTLSFLHKPLTDEHRRAQRVKREAKVLVCLGNPPYDRQEIDPADDLTERKGGWVRFGEALSDKPPLLDDFLRPARTAGQGVHLKNLYNDYVYFWRWALWKVFESDNGPGIVSFITASSYLRGPGFVGMRQLMRELADDIWIIDLEGDGLGTRKTENVFAIRRPVAIAVAVRYGRPAPSRPAAVHHARIQGTRNEKLARLESIRAFSDLQWRECFSEWQAPFPAERRRQVLCLAAAH